MKNCKDCNTRQKKKEQTNKEINGVIKQLQLGAALLTGIGISGIAGFGTMVLAVMGHTPPAKALGLGILAATGIATWITIFVIGAHVNSEKQEKK